MDAEPPQPDQERLDRIAAWLRCFLERDHAEEYAGLVVRADDHEVVVYRLATAWPRLDDAVRRRFGSDQRSIRFESAPFSRRFLAGVRARIAGDFDYWTGRGVTISTLGVSPTGTDVRVGVTEAGQRRTVRDHCDGLPVVVVVSNPVALPYVRRAP